MTEKYFKWMLEIIHALNRSTKTINAMCQKYSWNYYFLLIIINMVSDTSKRWDKIVIPKFYLLANKTTASKYQVF